MRPHWLTWPMPSTVLTARNRSPRPPSLAHCSERLRRLARLEAAPGCADELQRQRLSLACKLQPSLTDWVRLRRCLLILAAASLIGGLAYGMVRAREPRLDDLGQLDARANLDWLLGTPLMLASSLGLLLAAQAVACRLRLVSLRLHHRLAVQLPLMTAVAGSIQPTINFPSTVGKCDRRNCCIENESSQIVRLVFYPNPNPNPNPNLRAKSKLRLNLKANPNQPIPNLMANRSDNETASVLVNPVYTTTQL